MEGMMWGVAAMVVKDVVKNPYLKGRDYERNVRQVYRDVDNLRITMDQVKTNCAGEDLENGPYSPYIRRAEKQLNDAYRTLKKDYPRKAGLTKLLDYAATPGAEMHLLDIGKEANQTSRGLGDLLSEIRFAKIGKKEEPPPPSLPLASAASPKPVPRPKDDNEDDDDDGDDDDVAKYEHAVSDDSASDRDSLFDPPLVRAASAYSSQSSSTSSQPRPQPAPSARGPRRHSASDANKAVPTPAPRPRLASILEPGPAAHARDREREHALDSLQTGIDRCLAAPDRAHEAAATAHLQHALAAVLRLQRAGGGFAGGARCDEDLGDAVEDLDDAVRAVLRAPSGGGGGDRDRERKYAARRLAHAFEDVDDALARRRRHRAREQHRSPRRLGEEAPQKALPVPSVASQPPTRGRLRRQNTSDGSRNRRYSMYK